MSPNVVTGNVTQNPDPGGSVSRKRRPRPPKSVRDAQKATPGSPAQPRPQSGPSSSFGAQSFAAVASSVADSSAFPAFRPGSHPVVFSAGAPEASVTIGFTPDFEVCTKHAEAAFDAVTHDDRFAEFASNITTVRDDADVEHYRSEFVSSAVLCAAQNLAFTRVTSGLPAGDFSPLVQSDLVHLRSVRQIMSQYGDFRFDRVGQRYSVVGYSDTIKAGIRLASQLLGCDDSGDRSRVSERSWLPVSPADERFRFILAVRFAELIKVKDVGFTPDVTALSTKLFSSCSERRFSAGGSASPTAATYRAPFRWWSSVFTPQEMEDFSVFWGPPPSTAQAVVEMFCDQHGQRRLAALDLQWSGPSKVHLEWNTNWKAEAERLVGRWAVHRPVLSRFFEVESRAQHQSAAGSTAQIGSSCRVMGVSVLSTGVDAGSGPLSLAAVFPPRAYHAPDKECDVRLTTTAPLQERAVGWIQRDLRK